MCRDAGAERRWWVIGSGKSARGCLWLSGLLAAAGCAEPSAPVAPVSRSRSALTRTLPAASDTFINSHNPDNNNGASLSIFTGRDGMGGVMRGLIRFELPARLQGRVTVTGVQLTLTTRGLGSSDSIVGTEATESLQAISQPWTAGNGAGNAQMQFVVGEPCAGAITGATWNQPSCGTAAASWTTAGGSVVAAVSAQAQSPAGIDSAVTWDAAAAGNAGLIADVQGWIDAPASNQGWRITSSTEGGANALAQRFYATEAPINAPVLSLAYDCKTGFGAAGEECTTCVPNHCRDAGDSGAICNDPLAPMTGYECTCSAGFIFDGTTCLHNGTGGTAGGTGGAAGAGGTGGAAGAAGTGGAAGAGGATGTAGASGRDAGTDSGSPPAPPGSSGCSCALAGGGPPPMALLLLGAALAVRVGRRRDRRK